MNKKKIINIFELILQICVLLMLLLGTFAEYTTGGYLLNGKWIPKETIKVCFSTMFSNGLVGSVIVIGLMLANIIMCIISICDKTNKKDSTLHSILPIVIFAFSFLYILLNIGSTERIIYPIFNVFLIVMFLIILLGFIKRSKIIVPTEKTQQNIQEKSNVDELKKYKDLLDSGAITQEEYEQNKKQLLGL